MVEVPLYNGGAFVRRVKVDHAPVASTFVYVEADTFLGHFVCSECGFYNSYEGDQCSCRRLSSEQYVSSSSYADHEPALCESCGEEKEDEYEELCKHCHDSLYVYCWDCGENEQVEDSNYCLNCQPKYEDKS